VGQPLSGLPTQFLAWSGDKLAALGQEALGLIWDTASWHQSAEVRHGLRAHNYQGKAQRQGVRIVACRLPRQSPGLHPIEPKGGPGKRAVVAPEWVIPSAAEWEARGYASDACEPEWHLTISEKAA
jgi:hypothetical protein